MHAPVLVYTGCNSPAAFHSRRSENLKPATIVISAGQGVLSSSPSVIWTNSITVFYKVSDNPNASQTSILIQPFRICGGYCFQKRTYGKEWVNLPFLCYIVIP